jgi:hypothetical protein
LLAGPRSIGREADGLRIDPGRLIETAYRDRHPEDVPETYVLAWLAILAPPVDTPRAAAKLVARLSRLHTGVRSSWQRRLIELLEFIARHRRRKPAVEPCPSE